jgi:hypothetical protein
MDKGHTEAIDFIVIRAPGGSALDSRWVDEDGLVLAENSRMTTNGKPRSTI